MYSRLHHLSLLAAAIPLLALGQPAAAPEAPAAAPATDPTYRLSLGDRLAVLVFGEPDLNAQQMIDRHGIVRLPLIGEVVIAGQTVREAENLIEDTYRKEEMLRNPQVTLTLVGYAPREVVLLGAVRSPGTFQFPADATRLDLRDVIARQGGFTPVAKSDAVAVTRRREDGRETTVIVNVERTMSGRARDQGKDEAFFIYPGDRIFVPERLF